MTGIFRKSAMLALGVAFFIGSFAWDVQIKSLADGSLIAPAQARVGRPLTPVSYAGVARRTTRRAVAVTSAAQPVVVAPPPTTTTVVVAPTTQTCVDTVNPDGSITRSCH